MESKYIEAQRVGNNPAYYLLKGIRIQLHAFTAKFAKKKFAQTCHTLITVGYCSGKNCTQCPLMAAHKKTLEDLANPELQHDRYLASQKEHRPNNYGATRSWDKNGHKTEVMHCGKEVK